MAGLRDDLQAKVMEAGKTTLHESMRYAQEIEVIQHNKRGHAVAAVANTSDTPVAEEEEDNFTEEEPGHIQKDCCAHLCANAPMVDANGKPYEKKVFAAAATNGSQVNAITLDDAAKSHTVGSIVAGAMNALNW